VKSVCKHGRRYIHPNILHTDVNTGTSEDVVGFMSGWPAHPS